MAQQKYTNLQIALHWAIAILIAANWFMGEGMGKSLETRLDGGSVTGWAPLFHVWVGVGILALAVIRIAVRLASGAPAPVAGAHPLLEKAATWGHRLLYALMLAVPASGAAAWFVGIVQAAEGHEVMVNLLVLVVAGHTAAALFHQYVLKDRLIARMMPGR